jgi:hypothetical protein
MTTAIIAHADRDGIVAAGFILRHLEPDARVFPVGRVGDIDRILLSCAETGCPDRFYIIGYACRIPPTTWNILHPLNPRVLWFDHHLPQEGDENPPPSDMVRVFLPRPGEKNAPASMVADYIFHDVSNLEDGDKDLLMRIYEVLPPDDIVDFLDGLHAGIRGVQYSEMTDFVAAVMQRSIPTRYRSFLEVAKNMREDFKRFVGEEPQRMERVGDAVLVRVEEGIADIPRAILSSWARGETQARIAVISVEPQSVYVNVRHDALLNLHERLKGMDGLSWRYISGHPYVAFLDGCVFEGEDDPALALVRRLGGPTAEKG